MRIAILGAGGFIGSHLVEHLVPESRYDVVGLDVSHYKLEGLDPDDFVFHRADLREAKALVNRIVRESDVVFDLVAYANPSMYVTSPVEVFNLNFRQNLLIAEKCLEHDTWLVQFSSAEVYGKANSGTVYSEESSDLVFGPIAKQRWIYGSAKELLERVIYAYGKERGLRFTIIRPFNFIGHRIDYLVPPGTTGGPRVFPHFISALITGGPMYLVDGGAVHRSFTHIDDAKRGIQTILEQPERAEGRIFNIGNPDNDTTIRELAVLMRGLYREITGEEPTSPLRQISSQEFYGEGYEDGDRLPPDISRLKALGWRPRHGLKVTFRDAMEKYLAQRNELRREISIAERAPAGASSG